MISDTKPTEIDERLQAVIVGPWANLATRAKEFLLPGSQYLAFADTEHATEIENLALLSRDAARQKEVARLLRGHWEEAIEDPSEIEVRDSFDEALTELQLIELALETGYLPESAVRLYARRRILELLWSKGARKFVRNYGYVAVGWLAARVGLSLEPGDWTFPEPIRGEQRFASFLGEIRDWYDDGNVTLWLDFLDDYQKIGDDQRKFESFLGRQKVRGEDCEFLIQLLTGAQTFVVRLSALAGNLTPQERPRYGCFFAYWLARLHGFDIYQTGYARDQDRCDWSNELIATLKDEDVEIALEYRTLLLDLRKFWEETCEFLQARTPWQETVGRKGSTRLPNKSTP